MKTSIIIMAMSAFVCTIGCTPKAILDQGTRNNLNNQSITAEKLQFYLDRDIELKRVITSNDTKLDGGKITFANGKRIEVVYFKANTPGVCLKSDPNTIDVAFDTKGNNCLSFKPVKNYQDKDCYTLSGFEKKGDLLLIKYGENIYSIDERYTEAKILIKRKIAHKTKTKVTKVKGRKL